MSRKPTALVTNDDGHGARGLDALRDALVRAGMDVTVVAPDRNHSAGGHRIMADSSLRLRRVDGVVTTFTCSGTPADCIRVGVLSGLVPTPDVVVTGINHGANAGEDVHYSGTVSAAVEAAMLGVPAIAVSQDGPEPELPFWSEQDPDHFLHTDYLGRLALWVAENGLPDRMLLSVNVPHKTTGGFATLSPLGRRHWSSAAMAVEETGPDEYVVETWATLPPMDAADDGDFGFLCAGVPTINVLSADRGLSDVLHHRLPDLQSLPLQL
jgi:5'-nucleotidase